MKLCFRSLFPIPYSLLVCFLLLVVGFWLLVPSAHAFTFSRNLSLGSQGQDVLELQKILNSDSYTKVADTGPGSPGNETAYFGTLTAGAVARFQQEYAPEVLFPAGIYKGTGFVGLFTLAKLNSVVFQFSAKKLDPISVNSTASTETAFSAVPSSVVSAIQPFLTGATKTLSSTTNVYNPFSTRGQPRLFNLSAYEAKHGQSVTIKGSSFTPTDNSIVFDANSRIDNLPSGDGSSITFTIPDSVPNGSYNLVVENNNGSTLDVSYGNFFKVTDTPSGSPVITSITPSVIDVANITSPITIKGENFDATNDILSSLGNLSNVPSDGRTITFSLMSLEHTPTLINTVKARLISFPVYIFVKNSHGVTQTPQKVILNFK